MSASIRVATYGLFVAAAILSWDAWVHVTAAEEQRETAAAVAQESASYQSQAGILTQREQRLAKRRHALEQRLTTLKETDATAAKLRPLIATQVAEETRAVDPTQITEILSRYNRRLSAIYGGLIRRMGLTPSQAKRFAEIMTEREGRRLDLSITGYAMDLDTADPAYKQIETEDADVFRHDMVNLLGEDGFRQLEHFVEERPARTFVTQVLGASLNTADPVSPDQAMQLEQIIQSCQAPGSLSPNYSRWQTLTDVDWNAVESKAAGVLTPVQQQQLMARIAQAKYQDIEDRLAVLIRQWTIEQRGHG